MISYHKKRKHRKKNKKTSLLNSNKSKPSLKRIGNKFAYSPAAVSAMTMTTTDDITEGCQTRENSVIEPRSRRRPTYILLAFAYAIVTLTVRVIKFKLATRSEKQV